MTPVKNASFFVEIDFESSLSAAFPFVVVSVMTDVSFPADQSQTYRHHRHCCDDVWYHSFDGRYDQETSAVHSYYRTMFYVTVLPVVELSDNPFVIRQEVVWFTCFYVR